MKNFTWLLSVAMLVALLGFNTTTQAAENKKRNIVFILVDDQRFDAIGKLNSFFKTPHLDELMDDGVYFPNAFVTNSLCSPSRASFLTGQWPHKHGVLGNGVKLDLSTPTFPQELQKAGYKTAFIGKWHMGSSDDNPRPGFDYWVSFRGQGKYFDQTFNINGKKVESKGHNTDRVTDFAIDFIKSNHDKPFMAYVSHKAVHDNFSPAKRHAGTYDDIDYNYPASMANTDENYAGKPPWVRAQRPSWHGVDGLYNKSRSMDDFTKRYGETMQTVDDSVGRIIATLKEEGLLDSTLLVFTSDNGFQFGEHGLIDKRTMYEASIKIPFIVHCPELFEGGQKREQMVLNVDLFPTLMDVAGAKTPDSVQGQSFLPALMDPESKGRTSFVYEYFWANNFPQTPTVIGVRTDTHKLMRYHGVYGPDELYDIKADPEEMNNLIGDYYSRSEAGSIDARMRPNGKASKQTQAIYKELRKLWDEETQRIGITIFPEWVRD